MRNPSYAQWHLNRRGLAVNERAKVSRCFKFLPYEAYLRWPPQIASYCFLLLVVRSGATSSALAPSGDALLLLVAKKPCNMA